MATTSIWKVKNRINHVIDYVTDTKKTIGLQQVISYTTNEEKTFEHQYVSCINCMQNNPYQSMMNTKEMFHDKKKIVCFHGYQSFAEGEVTPELAHQIGVELAEKLWGNRFEVVVSTHLNTDNIHNHFVLNATSCVDGKRYCNTKKDLYDLRVVSDDLCRKYERKELNGFQKLYVYYQFKLGILPKSNHTRPKYTKELRQAMKQLDHISNETILLCKNNIETLGQLNQYKIALQEQLSHLESKRLQCRNKIRRSPEGTLKEQLKAESKSYTPEIKRLRKELQCCERIKERSLYLQQFEIETQSRIEKGRSRL